MTVPADYSDLVREMKNAYNHRPRLESAKPLQLRKTLPTFGARRMIREFDVPISHGIWRQHGLMKKRRRKYLRKQDMAHIKSQWAVLQQINAYT